MGGIRLVGVTVVRGGQTVLEGVDLDVRDGEAVALLGQSGSGKTSLLRAVAGHDTVTAGHVFIGERDVTAAPPRDRNLGMVAQGAPLHPTRDVEGNLRLPFELRGEDREEGRNRALGEALRFGLQRLLGRRPQQLSEGQRATAAMARSVVGERAALLLDEPAAQLDHQSRAKVLQQVGIVQRTRGTTILVATNDVTVAAKLAQRVAVIDRGDVAQVGPLAELRSAPVTLDVADLVHLAPLSRLPARVVAGSTARRSLVRTGAGDVPTWDTRVRARGGPVQLAVAAHELTLVDPDAGMLSGVVARVAPTGARQLVSIDTPEGRLVADVRTGSEIPPPGAPVGIEVHRALVADEDGTVLAVLTRP